jgi:hypothetical protein
MNIALQLNSYLIEISAKKLQIASQTLLFIFYTWLILSFILLIKPTIVSKLFSAVFESFYQMSKPESGDW